MAGKATQAAVFGIKRAGKGEGKGSVTFEILWTAKFPDLDQAMYWGAKKEMEIMRRRSDKFMGASRVLWQHELSPEQAVAAVFKQMKAQLDRAMAAADLGGEPDIGEGPMKPVDYSKAKGLYIEVEGPNGPDGPDPIEPFFVAFDDENEPQEPSSN